MRDISKRKIARARRGKGKIQLSPKGNFTKTTRRSFKVGGPKGTRAQLSVDGVIKSKRIKYDANGKPIFKKNYGVFKQTTVENRRRSDEFFYKKPIENPWKNRTVTHPKKITPSLIVKSRLVE